MYVKIFKSAYARMQKERQKKLYEQYELNSYTIIGNAQKSYANIIMAEHKLKMSWACKSKNQPFVCHMF